MSSKKRIKTYIVNYIINSAKELKLKDLQHISEGIKNMNKEEIEETHYAFENNKSFMDNEYSNRDFKCELSQTPTNHRVKLDDGSEIYTNCTIDAIGAAFASEQNADIVSICSYCNREIKITIKNKKIVKFDPIDIHILNDDLAGSSRLAHQS